MISPDMTMQAAQLAVAEARLWLGTPYIHQASCRGAGADCLGLIRGIWRRLYGGEPCRLPAYSADWAEAGAGEPLLEAAQLWLIPKGAEATPGDVILFRMREGGVAKHLGLQSETGADARFIHAFSGHAVTESALTLPWARRIAARFSFPPI
ncbi:C40 family peptidase [Pseudogemmobacter bohemicus]|uniref:NlpC/P60 family protein n=1 Tax=Pseudogemmobacter bohemicus TaxID=2250708 RepID=UPI001E2D34E7|nr:NlpC/P60 family protein [Pseudogemmobacter bohemicus]